MVSTRATLGRGIPDWNPSKELRSRGSAECQIALWWAPTLEVVDRALLDAAPPQARGRWLGLHSRMTTEVIS